MIDSTVGDYLSALAAKQSTPGGGAAAAITGAQAAALISMVCEFTRDQRAAPISDLATETRQAFVKLAIEDAEAFEKVMAAWRLPSESPDKADKLQAALRAAATPPLKTLELANDLASHLPRLEEFGNRNLITDTAIAAQLLYSTILASELNARINLSQIDDNDFRQAAEIIIKVARKRLTELQDLSEATRKNLLP